MMAMLTVEERLFARTALDTRKGSEIKKDCGDCAVEDSCDKDSQRCHAINPDALARIRCTLPCCHSGAHLAAA
jgi:hypothetical protein